MNPPPWISSCKRSAGRDTQDQETAHLPDLPVPCLTALPSSWSSPGFQTALILTLAPEARSSCCRVGARDWLLLGSPGVSVKYPASHVGATSPGFIHSAQLSVNCFLQLPHPHWGRTEKILIFPCETQSSAFPSLSSLDEEAERLLTHLRSKRRLEIINNQDTYNPRGGWKGGVPFQTRIPELTQVKV